MTTQLAAVDAEAMTIDDTERALFQAHAAALEAEAKTILAGITNQQGAERAMLWRIKQREYIKSVDASPIAKLKEYYREKWAGMNAEYKGYVDPAEKWMKAIKDRADAWYTAEAERVRLAHTKATAKAVSQAEDKQAQKVQMFMDLGKPQQAQAAAQKPLIATLPALVMPKIKHAVWKKSYQIQIDDLGAVLRHIAKNPKYHGMINEKLLTGQLEQLAGQLAGNMKEFPGLRCFSRASSSAVGGPH